MISHRSVGLFVLAFCPSVFAQPKPEPLESAWVDLVVTGDAADARQALTSAQRYTQQIKAIDAAQKKVRGKTYSLRLRCIGVLEPTQLDKRMLVHGQYSDPKHRKLFGENATVGIWTSDYATALKLQNGDEFDVVGKIFYEIHFVERDAGKLTSLWQEKNVNTSVAYLTGSITQWVREARIYMINPKIVPTTSSP